MDEYIEREAAITAIRGRCNPCGEWIEALKSVPAADVAPVRHEKWEVVIGSDGKERMICTGCRKQQDLTGVFSYCPNCGAKMDLEDSNG